MYKNLDWFSCLIELYHYRILLFIFNKTFCLVLLSLLFQLVFAIQINFLSILLYLTFSYPFTFKLYLSCFLCVI